MTKKQKKTLYRIIITAILLVIANLIQADNKLIGLVVYLIPYILIGHDIVRKAFKGIINKEVFDENFLMVVATLGSMAMGEFRNKLF